MRVAIYTRVSTDRQTHNSQLSELHEYCTRRGWHNVEVFSDKITGSKFTRKGLEELMAKVRRGRINLIACYKLDRLGRSLPHLAQIVAELTTHNTALVCTSQGIDTSNDNPAGRLQLGVLMAVAEFEREIIRERVNAGLKAARANGKRLGRPEKLSKYRERVRRLVQEGKGVRAISKQLGLPVSSTYVLVRQVKKEAA